MYLVFFLGSLLSKIPPKKVPVWNYSRFIPFPNKSINKILNMNSNNFIPKDFSYEHKTPFLQIQTSQLKMSTYSIFITLFNKLKLCWKGFSTTNNCYTALYQIYLTWPHWLNGIHPIMNGLHDCWGLPKWMVSVVWLLTQLESFSAMLCVIEELKLAVEHVCH